MHSILTSGEWNELLVFPSDDVGELQVEDPASDGPI